MNYKEELTPEEADVRSRELLQDLQRVYTPVDEAQSLERMRERLLAINQGMASSTMQTAMQPTEGIQQVGLPSVDTITRATTAWGGRWPHLLGTIAAVFVAAIMVGSLLLVLAHAQQTSVGGAGSSAVSAMQPAKGTVPSAAISSHDWKPVTTFSGIGSKTIVGQQLVFPQTLGAWFTCNGKGNAVIRLENLKSGKGFASTCHSGSVGSTSYELYVGAPYTLHQVYVVADPASTWKLQFALCVNTNACGYGKPAPPMLTPNPAGYAPVPPTVQVIVPPAGGTPMPLPTVVPRYSMPPPAASTPMPLPTVAPRYSMPTPPAASTPMPLPPPPAASTPMPLPTVAPGSAPLSS